MPDKKIPATPADLLSPMPDIPHEDCGDTRRVPKERIEMEKFNYCNEDGECMGNVNCAPYSDCKHYKERDDGRCRFMDWYDGPVCGSFAANKEASAK